MPLTDFEKQAVVQAHGFDPNQFTTDDEGYKIISKPTQIQPSVASPEITQYPTPQQPQTSAAGAFAGSLAQAAPSAFGGGLAAAGAASLLGAGGALDLTGLGAPIGIPLTLAGIGLAGYAGSKATQAVQKQIEPDAWQQAVAQSAQEHPTAAMLGNIASMPIGGMSPNPKGLAIAGGAIPKLIAQMTGGGPGSELTALEKYFLLNSAAGAGLGAGQSLVEGGSAKDILESAGLGAVFNKPNAIGKMMGFHGELPQDLNEQLQGTLAKGGMPKQPQVSPNFRIPAQDALWMERMLTPQKPFVPEGPSIGKVISSVGVEGQPDIIQNNQPESAIAPPEEQKGYPLTPYAKQTLEQGKGQALNPTMKWFDIFKKWLGNVKGVDVDSSGVPVDSNGSPVAGQLLLEKNLPKLIKLNLNKAGSDTLPHEVDHALMAAMENSDRPLDQRFMQRYYDLISNTPEYKEWAAKTAGDNSPNEYAAQNGGYEFLRRHLNLDNESGFKTWSNDVQSYWKTRFGKNTDEADYRRMLNYDLLYSNRKLGDFTPSGLNTLLPSQQKNQGESATSDREQYDAVNAKLMDLMKQGKHDSPEFHSAWQEMENIKNRNGGMPPSVKNSPESATAGGGKVNPDDESVAEGFRKAIQGGHLDPDNAEELHAALRDQVDWSKYPSVEKALNANDFDSMNQKDWINALQTYGEAKKSAQPSDKMAKALEGVSVSPTGEIKQETPKEVPQEKPKASIEDQIKAVQEQRKALLEERKNLTPDSPEENLNRQKINKLMDIEEALQKQKPAIEVPRALPEEALEKNKPAGKEPPTKKEILAKRKQAPSYGFKYVDDGVDEHGRKRTMVLDKDGNFVKNIYEGELPKPKERFRPSPLSDEEFASRMKRDKDELIEAYTTKDPYGLAERIRSDYQRAAYQSSVIYDDILKQSTPELERKLKDAQYRMEHLKDLYRRLEFDRGLKKLPTLQGQVKGKPFEPLGQNRPASESGKPSSYNRGQILNSPESATAGEGRTPDFQLENDNSPEMKRQKENELFNRSLDFRKEFFKKQDEAAEVMRKLREASYGVKIEDIDRSPIDKHSEAKDLWDKYGKTPEDELKKYEYIVSKYGGQEAKDSKFSMLPLVKPEMESIREEANKHGNGEGDLFDKTYGNYVMQKDNVYGKGMFPIIQAARGLTQKQINHVEEVGINEFRDKQDYSGQLSPKELALHQAIRQSLLQKQQDQIAANQPVTGRQGVKRLPQVDPYYWPNKMDRSVHDILADPGMKAQKQQLEQDFINHNVAHGVTPADAQTKWNAIEHAYDKGEVNLSKFNANREMEGVGLPDSMLQRGKLMESMNSYFTRVAADRAFHDNFEKNPDAAALLDIKKDPWGNPNPTSQYQRLTNLPAAKHLIDKIYGESFDPSERELKSWNRVATSLMLGPLTNVHIMGSSVANSIQYTRPSYTIPAIMHGLSHLTEGIQHALQTGYLRKDFGSFRDIYSAQSDAIDRLNGVARTISNLGGREAVNKFTKGYLQAFGEYVMKQKMVEANNGSKEAINLMEHVDPNWTPGKTYTPDELKPIASNFASLIHGAHDARTLPGWMTKESAIQPFFQLASWNIAQTNQWMRHVWTPATQGNFVPLVMSTLGATAGGYLIKEMREKLSDKKAAIPSLQDMVNSDRGLQGNANNVAYNLMAMTSYVGYAGILSTLGKAVEDVAHKNIPQGAAFPLDEVISNPAKDITQYISAMINDPNMDYVQAGVRLITNIAKENFQLGRLGISWMANANPDLIPQEHYMKELNRKTQDYRRFEMAEGMPYDEQTVNEANPYLNTKMKEFKRTEDVGEAAGLLPDLINTAVTKANGNPDVLRAELQKIKQNTYETMPNPERMPISFTKYLGYVTRSQGPDKAAELLTDYIQHNTINKAKASMVPGL